MNLYPNLQKLTPITIDEMRQIKQEAEKRNEVFLKSFTNNQQNQVSSCCSCPQEIHPYLDKYKNDLPAKPAGVIIGTFPPASYLITDFKVTQPELTTVMVNGETLCTPPQLNFYHGNKNSLWNFIEGCSTTSVKDIIQFLQEKNWAYADIIYSCSRKKITNTKDADLLNIVPNVELIHYLLNTDSITHLWFTSSGTFNKKGIEVSKNGLVNIASGQAYNVFLRTLQLLGYQPKVSIKNVDFCDISTCNKQTLPSIFKHITCHYLEFDKKTFTVYTGPSPSQGANTSLVCHPNYKKWRKKPENTNVLIPTTAYRKHIFSQFLLKKL
jgi:hypothetical protein